MRKKWLIPTLKIIVLVVVVGFALLGKGGILDAWKSVSSKQMTVEWGWGGIAIAGFCGSMITSALVWRWLAWQMGESQAARRLPTMPLLGSYTFSQIGKYVPGKVVLLLMRIERAGRFGMSAGVCTLSTLLENALYIISGGLVGMTAMLGVLQELRNQGVITARQQEWEWPLVIAAVAVLAVLAHPAVFYWLVNRLLRRMKKPDVPPEQRLGVMPLLGAVVGFLPCWFFGGVALWASTRCVFQQLDPKVCGWFAGAYALSVILGMVSLLPAGLGVRELVLGVAVTLALSPLPLVGHQQAVKLAVAAAGLQRLFQVIAELSLGAMGAVATSPRGMQKQQTIDRVNG